MLDMILFPKSMHRESFIWYENRTVEAKVTFSRMIHRKSIDNVITYAKPKS